MAFDLKRTHASLRLGRLMSITSPAIEQEGLLVCGILEDGVEKVMLVAAPVGTEHVIGFTQLADSLPERTSEVEEVIVPTSVTFSELDLRHNNLITGQVRAVVVGGAALTPDFTYAGVPAAGAVKIDLVNGKLKFNAAESGARVVVTYRYELTLTQAKQKFGERFVNNRGLHAEFGQMEIGTGLCELWTDGFDASQDYSAGAPLTLGANGIITIGGTGPVLDASVIHVPGTDSSLLGVRIRFQA